MKAPRHPAEQDRVAALRSYGILDTPHENDFDDIVALAAAICQTEAATITFVDSERQWFKAQIGMPPEVAPLDQAICAHTLVTDGFLEIEDTRRDPRTSDNPACADPINLRFYAGAPLISTDGFPIGTLCVLGFTAKQLSPLQRQALQVLARQVMTMLNLRVALRNADTLRKEVDHRVKNSLQLVGSLISMQRRAATGADVRDALTQTRERVLALASLHATMQQSDESRAINLRRLVGDMCTLISKSMTDRIDLVADITDVDVTAKIASSVAVIVNEFASNSLKHAFRDAAEGTIRFTCHAAPDGMMELVCTDTGRGLSKTATASSDQTSTGLGLVAMQACADQINGTLSFDPDYTGCRMVLRFDPAAA